MTALACTDLADVVAGLALLALVVGTFTVLVLIAWSER